MSPSQLRIESPDFNRIISGDKRATHDAIKTLWLATNEVFSRLDRSRQYWTDVPFASGNFTASSGTWTVASSDTNLYRYLAVDRMMMVEFALENTTTSSGMGTDLYLSAPIHVSAQNTYNTGFVAVQGNIDEIGMISSQSRSSATALSCSATPGRDEASIFVTIATFLARGKASNCSLM